MAKRSTPSDKIPVDPLFQIPTGAEDQFTFTREGTDLAEHYELVDDVEVSPIEFDDGLTSDDAGTLAVPENFRVVSQILRRNASGDQVIDIVVEVENVEGAVKYEVQVTKV